MEPNSLAVFLDAFFADFDYGILWAYHVLAKYAGTFFTPIFEFITLVGEQGACFILAGFVMLLFKKTRKAGLCVIVAISFGALVTNFLLKDIIARPRPFEDVGSFYYEWWHFIGSPDESGYSFPSGHMTGAMAAMTAVFLSFDKRVSWTGFAIVLVMGMSRNYLMAHYPTDVISGVLIGAIAALASFAIINWFYRMLQNRSENKAVAMFLGFDTAERLKESCVGKATHAKH